MVTMGVCQGMQPIAGYNYGAQQTDRLMRVLKLAMIAATCITTAGFLVAELFPRPCIRLFTSDQTLLELSVTAINIIMVSFPLVGYQMVISNFFQSIGRVKVSIFLSLSRQMIFLLPLLLTLPPIFGIGGVWWSMPTADTISALVSAIIMYRFVKKTKMAQTNEDNSNKRL